MIAKRGTRAETSSEPLCKLQTSRKRVRSLLVCNLQGRHRRAGFGARLQIADGLRQSPITDLERVTLGSRPGVLFGRLGHRRPPPNPPIPRGDTGGSPESWAPLKPQALSTARRTVYT